MNQTPPSIFTKGGNADLVGLFQKHAVKFVIAGGAAVSVHGCRSAIDVDDLDILLEPSLENSKRVTEALTEGHISVNFQPGDLARPSAMIPLKLLHYWADILTPPSEIDFASLLSRSVPALIGWQRVLVVGRLDLVALIEIAVGRETAKLEKYKRDLACLKAE